MPVSSCVRRDEVVGRRVDCISCTEVRRGVAPSVDRIAHDDARRARDARALHDRDADAAEADHEHRVAGFDLRGVEHRADAGLHRAADHAHDVERRVVVDLDRAGLLGDHELAEPADAEAAKDRRTAARQTGCCRR